MTIDIRIQNQTARMTIANRFDASMYAEFKRSYTPLVANAAVQHVEVDISGTDYLDSSALGMLTILKEALSFKDKTVSLVAIPGRTSDILRVAHADKLFAINLPSGIKLDLRNK